MVKCELVCSTWQPCFMPLIASVADTSPGKPFVLDRCRVLRLQSPACWLLSVMFCW